MAKHDRSRSARTASEDRDALLRAAQKAFDDGGYADALALAQRATEAADRSPEGTARAAARRILSLALLYVDRGEEATRVGEEAVRVAHAARATKEEAMCELALAEVTRSRGEYLAALRHGARARALAMRAGDPETLRSVLADYALLLSRAGDDERARELFDDLLALPDTGEPPMRALRNLYAASATHRSAGRFDRALRTLEQAEALAREHRLGAATWSLAGSRVLVYLEMGALDEARALLAEHRADVGPGWQRAQVLALRAILTLAAGESAEGAERLANEGLAIDGVEAPTRITLERLRGQALLARGHREEAERIAVSLANVAAKGGTRANAAMALALAARAGNPDAWLLRWLGALALASGGVAARVEHEATAALVAEPDPIGALARMALGVTRARLVDRTPPAFRAAMKRTLRQVEARLAAARHARGAQAETRVDDATLRAMNDVGLAGSSPALLRAVATLARASKSDASLVLVGETGSGKELFARLAHRLSARARGPFVAVNCAAIPEPLLEAELFGHERGAFTGAERSRRGLFVEAEGGTLFLDEVGEMSAGMQAKLLRVLEDRVVRAVGGTRGRKVDVRVVAATHRDLARMVAAGSFREDLFYRLAAITVRIPALRERPEDIPTIARALLARDAATREHRLDVPALSALAEHTWPGNVRELANVLRVAATMADGSVIGRPALAEAIGASASRRGDAGGRAVEETTLAALRARHRAELRELVGRALASADGNKLRAARALGVSRQGLYRVLGETR